jgi:hypothetical protein
MLLHNVKSHVENFENLFGFDIRSCPKKKSVMTAVILCLNPLTKNSKFHFQFKRTIEVQFSLCVLYDDGVNC